MPRTTRNAARVFATLAVSAGLALPAAGCGQAPPPPPEIAVACVNAHTMIRVDDSFCPDWADDDDDDGFFPYFYPVGFYAHPIGYQVTGGHRVKPAGKIVVYRAPVQGGTKKVYTVPGKPAPPPAVKPPAPQTPARTTSNTGGGFRRFK